MSQFDTKVLLGMLSSANLAYKTKMPLGFMPAFLVSRGQRDISRGAFAQAEAKFRYAVAVQFLFSRTASLSDVVQFALFGKTNLHMALEDMPRSARGKVRFLGSNYALYRYLIYFGDFVVANKVRDLFIDTACELVKRKQYFSFGPFLFVCAVDRMPFSELYKQLSEAIIQKKVRKDRSLADLEKLLRSCINYSPACRPIASVLGPNYCKADLDCINSGEAVIRLNKNPSLNLEIEETNGRCDIVYFNREFPFILCQNGENVDSGNIKFRFRIEDSDLSQCLGAKNHENFQYYDRPNRLFPNGNANMGPAAVYDLVLRGYYVKIIGMDFFTSSNLYSRSHYSANKEESLMNMLARNHDVLSNFSFLKALLREGVVSAVGNTTILDDLTLEQYAQNVQGRFGFFDFS